MTTTKELIELLSQYPEDMEVFVWEEDDMHSRVSPAIITQYPVRKHSKYGHQADPVPPNDDCFPAIIIE